MSDFNEKMLNRLKLLEREVERQKVKEGLHTVNGKVGIGTTSPTAVLTIKGDGAVGAWWESYKILEMISSEGNATGLFRDYGVHQEGILRLMSTAGAAVADGYTILSIDAPSDNPLEATLGLVLGGGEIVDLYNMKYAGAEGWGFRYTRGLAGGIWKDFTINSRDLFAGPVVNHFTIALPSGNIGIGTTIPGAKLDISMSATDLQNYLRLTNIAGFSGGEPTIDFYNSAGVITTARIGSFPGAAYSASVLRFSVADSSKNLQERMRISDTGNVGIGTTTFIGSEKLRVNGDIYSDGDVSALTFTDRTPFYAGDALSEIKAIKGKDGKIDHATLPAFARVERELIVEPAIEAKKAVKAVKATKTHEAILAQPAVKARSAVIEIQQERDLGAMISMLTVAVQQLDKKLNDLVKEK